MLCDQINKQLVHCFTEQRISASIDLDLMAEYFVPHLDDLQPGRGHLSEDRRFGHICISRFSLGLREILMLPNPESTVIMI